MSFNWHLIQHLDQAPWEGLCANLRQHLVSNSRDETAFTALRAELLARIHAGVRDEPRLLDFLSAFSVLCHDSEFVFAVSAREQEHLAALSLGRDPAEDLIIRCYRAVDKEQIPTADVERLSPIANDTSRAVQAMYEENPYPRWKQLVLPAPSDEAVDILIAGCGSGRHILTSALSSPRSRCVGIDLSLASLAYALMKAREHAVSNVRLVHADMLDVARLGLSFDRISAVGSVHHMNDPSSGLRALASVLKPEGTLKVAVYSKAGRTSVLAGIALRRALGIAPTVEGIRVFRQIIYGLPADHPAKQLLGFEDFYSISGCRDLLFHVQEHNYTVAEIFDLIAASTLRLQSFTVPPGAEDLAMTRAGLLKLEKRNPAFAGPMFRFFLSRA